MTTQIEPQDLNALIKNHLVKVVDGSHAPVKVVDASWALDGTDMHASYVRSHIAGAVFFDLDAISDHSTPLPHMAPTPDDFARMVGHMGISHHDHVVIYDQLGLFSAARVWWTFRLMGHQNVQVLRGGFPAWVAAGLPVTAIVPTPVATDYSPRFRPEMVMQLNSLLQIVHALGETHILDARPRARFEGSVAEPRPGLRSGHMPGAQSLPIAELIRDGALKPRAELVSIFEGLGVLSEQTVITTCGSGVTAAIISMAMHEIGHTKAILYDGSWAEWGQTALNTPVVTGVA